MNEVNDGGLMTKTGKKKYGSLVASRIGILSLVTSAVFTVVAHTTESPLIYAFCFSFM